jgi:probable rRNA maturation factor
MPTKSTRRATPAKKRAPRLRLSLQAGRSAGEPPADRHQVRRWVLAALSRDAELTLRFVGEAEGRTLNAQFRGQDHATNVLTFAYDDDDDGAGGGDGDGEPLAKADIVICLPVVRREARAQRKPLRNHFGHLVIHGVLHAQGMDHEDERDALAMEAAETRILSRFRIPDPYRDASPHG